MDLGVVCVYQQYSVRAVVEDQVFFDGDVRGFATNLSAETYVADVTTLSHSAYLWDQAPDIVLEQAHTIPLNLVLRQRSGR